MRVVTSVCGMRIVLLVNGVFVCISGVVVLCWWCYCIMLLYWCCCIMLLYWCCCIMLLHWCCCIMLLYWCCCIMLLYWCCCIMLLHPIVGAVLSWYHACDAALPHFILSTAHNNNQFSTHNTE